MKFFLAVLKIFAKLFFSFVLGLFITFFLLRNDSLVRNKVTGMVKPYVESFFVGNTSFSIKSICFFPFCITFENLSMLPRNGDAWAWNCKKLSLRFPWFNFLLYGTVELSVEMQGLKIKSFLDDDGLCVWEHLGMSSVGPSFYIPVFLQSMTIVDGRFFVDELYTDAQVQTHFNIDMIKMGNAFKSTIRFLDGALTIKEKPIFKDLQGPVRLDVYSKATSSPLMIRPNCTLSIVQMKGRGKCFFSGSWRYQQGLFSLYNSDRSFIISPIKLYTVGDSLLSEYKGRFPVSYLYNFFSDNNNENISGQCELSMNVEFEGAPSVVRGTIKSGAIAYDNTPLVSGINFSFNRNSSLWNGKTSVFFDESQSITGIYGWDENATTGKLRLYNESAIKIPGSMYWFVMPKSFSANIKYFSNGMVKAEYNVAAKHEKTETNINTSGLVCWENDDLFLDGIVDEKKYHASCRVVPEFSFRDCWYKTGDGKTLCSLQAQKDDTKKVSGTISFSLIKQLLKEVSGYNLQGQGGIKLYGMIDGKKLLTHFELFGGVIRVPHTYNFINDLSARCIFDFDTSLLTIKDFDCSLNRGKIKCNQATFHIGKNYDLQFAHVPIVFNDCLINWNKDFFAIISGYCTFKKMIESSIKGCLFVDRSQLKKNIFSSDFQKEVFSLPGLAVDDPSTQINIDITVATKDPVGIKTSFLETSARLDLAFGGTINEPKPSGKISILSGLLAFPYKPLHVTGGVIDFSSGNLYDPVIEVSAKNKIKKYNVNLIVSGSLQEQDIMLESSPSLTQEQILSLLLAGSEQESLNLLMPALLLQNVKGLIFGSDQSPTGVRNAFGKLFKPFERIHLVPSFTDQTGRGGLRGALEIDVSERWRAMIQKNFSLTEDTKVEVEYLLSDDVSIRGMRDERGDVGAEVEMRWKF